jgi:hypothetical protein
MDVVVEQMRSSNIKDGKDLQSEMEKALGHCGYQVMTLLE